MEVVEKTNICAYIYCVLCSVVAEVFMIFGYNNNAWLVLYKSDSNKQFQRGLNDDCFKADAIRCLPWSSRSNNSSGFPEPFSIVSPPNAVMYLALHLARFLLIGVFSWILMCIICCCNLTAEQFAKKHRRSLMQFCSLVALSFVILSIFILIAYYTDRIIMPLPPSYQRIFGSGFWLFIAGGTGFYLLSVFLLYKQEISAYLSKRQSHEPLARHELDTMPS
ncbi:hypothetical protein KIN20_011919 [Parelaphostrongylus tenuis]|uniref:Uncharacterized protein n=1 Tax=Parelaphostrongylus tenuis TaxID=148309 RepID=A0AAD5QLD2_PARTN|nr:hypothetical protein KIN20_011919 [Parelaphostrongylus tenuis]